MPRTSKSEITNQMGDTVYFFSELDMPLPMPNVSYELALKHDKKHFVITFSLVPGTGRNVKFVRGSWRLEPYGRRKTKVTYTLFTEPDTIVPDFIINIATDLTLGQVIQSVRDRVYQ